MGNHTMIDFFILNRFGWGLAKRQLPLRVLFKLVRFLSFRVLLI